MEHYQIYLRGELGKLRYANDARKFCFHVPKQWRDANDLPATIDELTARFQSQEAVDDYVASLSKKGLVQLTNYCGTWRNNRVPIFLSSCQQWVPINVPVSHIMLSPADAHLLAAFKRNNWQLEAIANDPEVLASYKIRVYPIGEMVRFPICLARAEGNHYRIFDGMHRAIQLVRNGEDHVPLCVAKAGDAKDMGTD